MQQKDRYEVSRFAFWKTNLLASYDNIAVVKGSFEFRHWLILSDISFPVATAKAGYVLFQQNFKRLH
jgi:hypothetical protein